MPPNNQMLPRGVGMPPLQGMPPPGMPMQGPPMRQAGPPVGMVGVAFFGLHPWVFSVKVVINIRCHMCYSITYLHCPLPVITYVFQAFSLGLWMQWPGGPVDLKTYWPPKKLTGPPKSNWPVPQNQTCAMKKIFV